MLNKKNSSLNFFLLYVLIFFQLDQLFFNTYVIRIQIYINDKYIEKGSRYEYNINNIKK